MMTDMERFRRPDVADDQLKTPKNFQRSTMSNPVVYVDVYKGRKRLRQAWRWRASNAGNGRLMAHSGEAYVNKSDCLTAITQLFGGSTTVYMREAEHGDVVMRFARPE
jgi:uncharacterized protein YegP (UPF0339 family)